MIRSATILTILAILSLTAAALAGAFGDGPAARQTASECPFLDAGACPAPSAGGCPAMAAGDCPFVKACGGLEAAIQVLRTGKCPARAARDRAVRLETAAGTEAAADDGQAMTVAALVE